MKPVRPLLRLFVIGLIGAWPPARALAAESDVFAFFQEEASVMAATLEPTPVSEAPGTVIVISQDEIRQRGYRNLKDIFRDLPGMEVDENYFSEIGTLVPVRGVVGNNKIVVLVNGMRVNPPGGEEMPLRSDFSVREAEQIEVVYGPGSTLYGQDAISAIVNVITKKPEEKTKASANVSVGSNRFMDGGAAFSRKWDEAGFSAYAQYTQSDLIDLSRSYPDWWSNNLPLSGPRGSGTVPSRWDDGFNGFLRLENSNNSFQFWHRESSRSTAEGGFANALGYVNEAIWHDRSTVMEGKNRLDFTDDFNLESSLTYNRYEIDPESRYVEPGAGNTWFLNDNKYGFGKGVTLEEKMSYQATDTVSLIGGAVASDFDILPKATFPGGADPNGDLLSQGGFLTYYTRQGDPSSRVDVQRVHELKYQNYAAYAESHWQALDRLKLILGGRIDESTRFSDDPISPRFAAIYRATPAWVFKYTFTRAYVSPSPYYSYDIFDNGINLNTSNNDLKPEKAQSHEINATYSHRNLSAGLSGYWNNQSNLLVIGDNALPVNIIQPVVYLDAAGTQTRVLTHSANGGTSVAKGFDLYGHYKSGRASFWASYSYVDFKTDMDGVVSGLNQTSRHNVRIGLTDEVLSHLFVTPSVMFRSTPENITNTYNLADELKNPYAINLHVLYALSSRWDLFADLQNLTDHHYALRGELTPNPQDTIHGSAGVQVRFGGAQ